ncbi:unnamed protein product [Rhizophagus irregularis]|nr:unnamed protein product [Rhizophagus irregularis]CAB5380760.1 unnamed protein product [Rhizophagus irregularis]
MLTQRWSQQQAVLGQQQSIILPVPYLKKFEKTFSCRVEFIFEEKWAALLQKYDDAANYLQCYLYKCKEA